MHRKSRSTVLYRLSEDVKSFIYFLYVLLFLIVNDAYKNERGQQEGNEMNCGCKNRLKAEDHYVNVMSLRNSKEAPATLHRPIVDLLFGKFSFNRSLGITL